MFRTGFNSFLAIAIIFCLSIPLHAQDHIFDDDTGTIIHFNNNTDYVNYKAPAQSQGLTYLSNQIQDKAANFLGNDILKFAAENTVDHLQGSIETWVKPSWFGNDGQSRIIFQWGGAGGMLFEKDGGGYLKLIVNRYGSNSAGNEIGVAYNVNDWTPGIWHHVACTWNDDFLKLYIDGALVSTSTMPYTPPAISATNFNVGSINGVNVWTGQIDDMRFSKYTRLASEITANYNNADPYGASHDSKSTMILRFNGNAQGAFQYDSDVQNGYQNSTGIWGRCAVFSSSFNTPSYPAAGNINSSEGTFETWVRPYFEPEPGNGDHTIMRWGGFGGLLLFVNGGSTLRFIANRFSANGNPEININIDVQGWDQYAWNHIAVTWSNEKLEMYINGAKISESAVGFNLPSIPDETFHIASDNGAMKWLGGLDEVRISNTIRSADDIASSFLPGVSGFTLKENNITKFPNWRYKPKVCATVNGKQVDTSPSLLDWTSTNNWVASVDDSGVAHFHNGGTNVSFIGTGNGASVQLNAIVADPLIDPIYPSIDPAMTTPADCAKEDIKVLIINYFPTEDGVNLDVSETGPDLGFTDFPLDDIENTVNSYSIHMKHMNEERTKFRGYKNPDADPYLSYEVVDYITVYEPLPRFVEVPFQGNADNGYINFIDMVKVAERFDWQDYVDNQDVDEIWVWGYHNDTPGGIFGWESDMASPTTIDVSNSSSFGPDSDLPIYSKTYTVFGFNYGRTPNLHNQGHQLESLFGFIDNQFFRDKFVGWDGANPPIGRAGDTHHPPNTTIDYDYFNTNLVASDIEDWEPNGGPTKLVNVDTWAALDYNWPYGDIPPGETEVNYYIYWMQSIPGYLNTIPYNNQYLTNWWEFVGNWDEAISNNLGLVGNNPTPISPNDDCAGEAGCTEYSFNSFEGGFEGWTDGGIDCARSSAYPNTGNISVRLRDNSGVASSVISPVSDWSAASTVKVEFSYYPRSMETNEDFFLEVSTNGGSSWTLVQAWARGTDFNNDTRYDESVNIEGISFTSNSRIRFRCDASGNGDYIYLDDVKISTCTGDTPSDCVDFDSESFESGWGIWNDGGSDCVWIAANPGTGNNSIRIRDNTSTSNMTTDNLALAGVSSVEIDFHYYAYSMEANEDFFLEVSTNGGASYTSQFNYVRGIDFENYIHYDESVTFYGPFTNSTKFRFRCDASSNYDQIFIDDVVIRNCDSGADLQEEALALSRELDSVIKLYPNPAAKSELLNVQVDAAKDMQQINIFDMKGQLMKSVDWNTEQTEMQVRLTGLNAGTYNVQLISETDMTTHKLIIVE